MCAHADVGQLNPMGDHLVLFKIKISLAGVLRGIGVAFLVANDFFGRL